LRATTFTSVNGTFVAGGAAVGRGFDVGIFLHDVSDLLRSNAINIDTPIGGISVLVDDSGHFLGLTLGGPSLGLGASLTGPVVGISETTIIADTWSPAQKTFVSGQFCPVPR